MSESSWVATGVEAGFIAVQTSMTVTNDEVVRAARAHGVTRCAHTVKSPNRTWQVRFGLLVEGPKPDLEV